jgi:hypothetical protein
METLAAVVEAPATKATRTRKRRPSSFAAQLLRSGAPAGLGAPTSTEDLDEAAARAVRARKKDVLSAAGAGAVEAAQLKQRKPRAAPKPKPLQPRRVLSIDVGLRNLGLAVVSVLSDEQADRLRTSHGSMNLLSVLSSEATAAPAAEATASCCELLLSRIRVDHAENVDVLEENGCNAKNAKAIGPLRQVAFWHECMMRRWDLLLDPPPDLVVVEVQDGGNATMRQMSTGIVGLFMGHFQARHKDGKISRVPEFTMVRGDMKLKICNLIDDAWGSGQDSGWKDAEPGMSPCSGAAAGTGRRRPQDCPRRADEVGPSESLRLSPKGDGQSPGAEGRSDAEATKQESKVKKAPPAYLLKVNPRRYYALQRAYLQQQAEAEGGEVARRSRMTGRTRAAYEERKRFAVYAFELYVHRVLRTAPWLLGTELGANWSRYTQKKRRDISDAVLQGIYVICRDVRRLGPKE